MTTENSVLHCQTFTEMSALHLMNERVCLQITWDRPVVEGDSHEGLSYGIDAM